MVPQQSVCSSLMCCFTSEVQVLTLKRCRTGSEDIVAQKQRIQAASAAYESDQMC